MTNEVQVTSDSAGEVVLSFEEAIYPRDAVFGAAYTLLDRCYVHLDRDGTKFLVRIRNKPGVTESADTLAGEFQNEALAQAWRRDIMKENQALIEGLTTRALSGAAGAPGLDDLLDADLDDLGDAFDDPLGIAVSWEEKYGKKGSDDEDAASDESSGSKDSGENPA